MLLCVIDPMFKTWLSSYRSIVLSPLRSGVQRRPVSSFIIITLVWSWSMWWLLRSHPALEPHSRLWTCLYVSGLSGPMVGAFAISLFTNGTKGIRSLLAQFCLPPISPLWYLSVIFLPIGAWMLAARLGHWHVRFGQPAALILILWLKMLVRGGPLTEELGWRGFLLPALVSRSNLFWATVTLIPIWAAWHLPLWFLPGVPHGSWSFPMFLLLLVPVTLIFSWLYVKGQGNLLLPILFHTSINTSFHFVPMVPPWNSSNSGFLVLLGFFWITAILLVLANRELWFRRPPARIPVHPAAEFQNDQLPMTNYKLQITND